MSIWKSSTAWNWSYENSCGLWSSVGCLKNIKTEIYAIQHKAYSRKHGHACHFSEKGQVNLKKAENIWKFGQKCLKFENVLKKCR